MYVLNNHPRPTKEQTKAALKSLEGNPNLLWDGQFGFYSNGNVVITVFSNDDPKKTEYKIQFDREGKQV